MGTPESFTDLLILLAGGNYRLPKLADSLGYTYWQVSHWKRKNKVPESAWPDIVRVAKEKGHKEITMAFLKKLSEEK